jgi:hypothetical protein
MGVQRAWSEVMNVLANPKGSVGRSNPNFWRLEQFLHEFLKQGCCRHLFLTHRCIQKKQRSNCEATQIMARKVHVYFKIWGFHLVTPPKCKKIGILAPSLKPPMRSSGQLQVHCQPLCGAIIEIIIRSLS